MKRVLLSVSAAALAGTVLPVSASAPAAGAGGSADPAFSGYSSTAWAAPVKVEIYEPTIPIPASPQAEFELGYSKVEADSGSSTGRASWLWPGDSVGEGAKTVIENLGLPPQISGPIAAQGYPVQVNASQPSGDAKQSDQPFPGTVMRTSAGAHRTVAQVGWSPDGQVQDGRGSGKGGDGSGVPGPPGLPGVPGLPLPGAPGGSSGDAGGALAQFGQAITGGSAASATAPGSSTGTASGDPGTPGVPSAPDLPPQLTALVDLEGYTSSSTNVVSPARVVTTARSALGDVDLLGGLVQLDGIVVTSSSVSNGHRSVPTGKATIGGITIAGQEFSFGPQGFEAAGKHQDIPGLPDQADQALAQLGITLELPKPERTRAAGQAGSDMAGLRVQIDTAQLRQKLDTGPIDDLVSTLPDNPQQLKSALQALVGLSPRIVLTLGNAGTAVETVQGIPIPAVPPPGGTPGGPATHSGGTAAHGGGAATSSGGSATAAAPAPAAGGAPSASAGNLGDAALTGSGLPPLYSIPGAIMAGGIVLAAVGGSWLRKIGAIALGGAGSCSHGLDTGLPDLRKVSR